MTASRQHESALGYVPGRACSYPSNLPEGGIVTEIQPFTFPATGQQVRSVIIGGEPWFVAADIAAVLGFSNLHSSLAQLDEDERSLHSVESGQRSMSVVSEPGLYSLIMRSRKPEAKAFKRWITHEVIPAIRRTGSYSLAQISRKELALMVVEAEEARERAESRALRAEDAVRELVPSANAWDVLAAAARDLSVADAAKILSRDPAVKLGERQLFQLLGALKWAFRQAGDRRWRAYQSAVNAGRLAELPKSYDDASGERVVAAPQVRVTLKGLRELHGRLSPGRQLPVAESDFPPDGDQ